jgi:hypothetical protein
LYLEAASLAREDAPTVVPRMVPRVEALLAKRWGLGAGEVLLEVPRKLSMLRADVLVRDADGSVRSADTFGPGDGFALPLMRPALLASAGRTRVFVGRAVRGTPSDRAAALREAIADAHGLEGQTVSELLSRGSLGGVAYHPGIIVHHR